VAKVVDKTWAFFSKPLDQGNTGTCVGHGWKHRLMAAPMVRKAGDKPSAFDIYDAAIKVDEWTDNDNDTDRQMGTSACARARRCCRASASSMSTPGSRARTRRRSGSAAGREGRKFVGGPS
jgi:hypothetical protein